MSDRWPKVRLSEMLQPIARQEAVDPTKEYRLLGVRLDGRGPFFREAVLGTATSAKKINRVKAGDFIYSRLFAWRGAFGIVDPDLDNCHVSSEFPTFLPINDAIDLRFLRYWFRLPRILRRVEDDCTGSTPQTRNRFNERFFLALAIPLPPITEQRRIVARIEELAPKVAEAQGLRRAAEAESAALVASASEDMYQELRSSHGTTKLGDVCGSITDGDHNTPSFTERGVRFIFVGNVSTGYLHFNDCKRVTEDYFRALRPTRVPKQGDLLYSAVGATLGIPAVVDTDERFCFQRHIAILKPERRRLISRFAWHMLRSRTVFDQAWNSSTGSAQPTIPLREIRRLEIPSPPLTQQREAVAYLDTLRAAAGVMQVEQSETAAELDALLPSILNHAFKGEL